MLLPQLPPEIIQLILQQCSTQSYLQASRSCRILHDIASSRRNIILHHLNITPGKKLDYTCLDTYDLFLLLRRRTAAHLYNAVFDTDRTTHTFRDKNGNAKRLDVSASSVCGDHGSCKLMALVFKDDHHVYLCRSEANGSIEVDNTAKCFLDCMDVDSIKIIKTAIIGQEAHDVLAVLVRGQNPASVAAPFAECVQNSTLRGNYFLLSFVRDKSCPQPGTFRTYIGRIYARDDYKAHALAAGNWVTFAISWEDMTENGKQEVVVYRGIVDATEHGDSSIRYLEYTPTKCVDNDGMWLSRCHLFNPPDFPYLIPITGLKFSNVGSHQMDLLLTHMGHSIAAYYLELSEELSEMRRMIPTEARQSCRRIQYQNDRLPVTAEVPFYAAHETYHYNEEDGNGICRWTFLAYGIASNKHDGSTMIFLLKSQAFPPVESCPHRIRLGTNRHRRNWQLVARLSCYPQFRNSSALGLIFAVSPRSTRIAVSDWDTLYVWTLNPDEFVQEATAAASSDYYPDAWLQRKTGLVSLHPAVLRQGAVCFGLMFTNEDNITMLTDRGLKTWDLGPHAQRRQIVSNLDLEAG